MPLLRRPSVIQNHAALCVPGSVAWVPTDLGSKLVGWYKADTGRTGDPVTTLADQSGNGYDLAPNGFTGPAYEATGLGGKPCLTFSGGFATGMRTTADTVVLGTGTQSAIFMLGNYLSGCSGGPYMAGNGHVASPATSADSWQMFLDASTPDISAFQNLGDYAHKAATLTTEHRFGTVCDGTNITSYVDGVAGTPSAKNFNFTTPGVLGMASGAFVGKVCEQLFIVGSLSAGELTSIDTYLVSRS